MRTTNPTLSEKVFNRSAVYTASAEDRMTLSGTVNKSAILILLTLVGASITWYLAYSYSELTGPLTIGGAIIGFILALVTAFSVRTARITGPLYAFFEGLFLGGFSAYAQSLVPDVPIITQAVALTIGVFISLLLAYRSGLIKATENFKLGVIAATGGLALLYLGSFVLGFFGMNIGFIHSSGPMGIIFSLVVVVIAALNLVLDFDFIEQGVEQGSPKYMEWYAAFGLLVTLVWLYVAIVRLLLKLASRD